MEDWKWVASELFLLSLSVVVETKSQPNRWQSKADKNGTIGKKSSLDDSTFTERKASKWLIIGWEEKLRITIEIKGENRKEK